MTIILKDVKVYSCASISMADVIIHQPRTDRL